MKKLLYFSVALVSAFSFAACQKDLEIVPDNIVNVKVVTDRILEPEAAVKTYMGENLFTKKPEVKWNINDAIALYEFLDESTAPNQNPSSTGIELTKGDHVAEFNVPLTTESGGGDKYTYVAVYPANAISQGGSSTSKFDRILIPQNQTAQFVGEDYTTANFDRAADVLIGKPVVKNSRPSETEFLSFSFTRPGTIGKLTLKNLTADEIVKSVELSLPKGKKVTGYSKINVKTGEISDQGYTAYENVKVTFPISDDASMVTKAETPCVVYFRCLAGTWAKDTEVTVKVETDAANYTKTTALPQDYKFIDGGLTTFSFNMATAERKIIETESPWKLLKDASTLSAGDMFKLACNTHGAAAGALNSDGKYLVKTDAKFSEDTVMIFSDDAAIFDLGGDAINGWSLFIDGTQVGYSGADLASNGELWTISVESDGTATIAQKKTGSNTMGYNAGSPRFKTYSSSQTAVQIYKFCGELTPLDAPSNVQASVDANVANTINVSWDAVENAAKYDIELYKGTELVNTAHVEGATSTAFTNLDYSTEYDAYVYALPAYADKISYSKSEASAKASATTGADTTPNWVKVTSLAELAAGDEIVIASADASVVMSKTLSTNNIPAIAVVSSVDEGTSIKVDDNALVLTLAEGSKENTFAFSFEDATGTKYLYAASSSSNHLKAQTDIDENASWTISWDTKGEVTVKANGANTRNQIRRNGTIFSCYSSGQTPVAIYKLEDSRTPLATPEITVTADSRTKTVNVAWTCADADKVANYTLTCGTESHTTDNGADGNYTFESLEPGTYSVTVVANPSDAVTYKPAKATGSATLEDLTPVINIPTWPSAADATATGVEFDYTITNPIDGKSLSVAITEGGDWITSATADGTKVTVSFGENASTSKRTGKLTLSYEGAENKTVNITQNGASSAVYANLAELVAAGKPSSTDVTVTVTLTNEEITSKASSYIVVKSGNQPIKLYKSSVPPTWVVGGTVSGTLTCPWCLYGSDWELKPNSWDDLNYTAPLPTCETPVITLDGANASITCATAGATILYEIADSEPSSFTHTYSGAVTLTDGQTIWAKATKSECKDSAVASKKYTATGADEESEGVLASWTFTSGTAGTNYPKNGTNFNSNGTSDLSSGTFYLNGTGSTWNTTKGYAFTAVTDVTITVKAAKTLKKGSKITFSMDAFYNKALNAPATGYTLTAAEGSATASTTGLSATSISLSVSSATKTVTYTLQNDVLKDGTVKIIYTGTGKAGSGQGYIANVKAEYKH